MSEPENDVLTSTARMFNWVEYTVFCSMLVFSLLIGVYYGWFRKQDTVAEYLLGGKKMGVFPVTMSLVFSHVSGVTLLGVPTEIYEFGSQYLAIIICVVMLLFITNYIFLPVIYDLQLNSLYEYLGLRFSKGTRTLASLVFAVSLLMFVPVVVYIPALAFNQVTGMSVRVISLAVSLICIFYTSFGGLKAVVWTDTLQSCFTVGSVLFIVILGFMKLGGVSEVIRINREGFRLEPFNFDPNPFERSTIWSVSLGSIFFWTAQVALHPGACQRFTAVSTLRKAKLVTVCSCICFMIMHSMAITIGFQLYANYHRCDPIAIQTIKKSGQIMPLYVMEVAKDFPGLTGLFISGVLSAALSTMSACLNTVAGTIYEDFVQFVMKGKDLTEAQKSFTLKMITLVLGVICASLVFVVERLGALFQMAISLVSVNNGALVGVFILGMFFQRANSKGAIAGIVSSLVATAALVFGAQYFMLQGLLKYPGKITTVEGCGANVTARVDFNASARVQTYTGVGSPVVADEAVPLIFQLSFMYYCTFGTLVALAVGIVVSYLTEAPDPKCLDPQLFTPWVRRFLPQALKINNKPPPEEYILVNTSPSPEDVKSTVVDGLNGY